MAEINRQNSINSEQEHINQNLFQREGAAVGGVMDMAGLGNQMQDGLPGSQIQTGILRIPADNPMNHWITDNHNEEQIGNMRDLSESNNNDKSLFDQLGNDDPTTEEQEEFGKTQEDFEANAGQRSPMGPPPDGIKPNGPESHGPIPLEAGPQHLEGPEGQKPNAGPGMPGNQMPNSPDGTIPTQFPGHMPGGLQTMPYHMNEPHGHLETALYESQRPETRGEKAEEVLHTEEIEANAYQTETDNTFNY